MIKKYKLDPIITKKFVKNNLSKTNTLSNLILQTLSKKRGSFYTYLQEGLTKFQVHDFLIGGKVKNNRKDISELLYNNFKSKNTLYIFDDVNTNPKELNEVFISENNVFIYKNEVYYIINSCEPSEVILKYLNYSSSIWHSLVVLSKKPYKMQKKPTLSQECLSFLSQNSTLILIEAYDGESYIFWESCEGF